jgi:hypothetical protein
MLAIATVNAATLGLLISSPVIAAPQGFSPRSDIGGPTHSDYLDTVHMSQYTPPSSYTGDVLNLTKCFCEDPNNPTPLEQDSESMYFKTSAWGHYYQFDYYNWHLNTLYSIPLTCSSREQVEDHRMMLPLCWDEISARKDCGQYLDGNMFCFQVGTLGSWSDKQMYHYSFNDQHRGLPRRHGVMEPDMCEGFCREKLGMVVARDAGSKYVKTWKRGGGAGAIEGKIESTFTTYVDTDDMCAGCK